MTPRKADSAGSAAAQSDSPGSVENQPPPGQFGRADSLIRLPGLLKVFRGGGSNSSDSGKTPLRAAGAAVLNANVAAAGGDAVPSRHSSMDEEAWVAKGTRRGPGPKATGAGGREEPDLAERSLALMDDGWSARSFLH